MIKVSSSLPDLAVLRGGDKDFKQSLLEGAEVLKSLSKIGYTPLDVLIDQEGIEKTASYILTFTLLFIWYKYLTRYRG